MLGPSHARDLDLHGLQHSLLDPRVLDVVAHEGAVRAREVVPAQHIPHARELLGRQRDHVRDAPHEGECVHALGSRGSSCQVPSPLPLEAPRPPRGVGGPASQARGRGDERVGDEQVAREQEHHAAGEVPAGLEQDCVGVGVWGGGQEDALGLALGEEVLELLVLVPSDEPAAVLGGEVDGAGKGARPEEVRGVVVRVGDGDGGEAAEGADALDGGGVEEGDAVPEDVAGGRAEEDAALADAKLGGCLGISWC